MIGIERRQYPRVKATAAADLICESEASRRRLAGRCLDLSVNGALLSSSSALTEGEEILLRLNLTPETVECRAKVLRSYQDKRTGRWKSGCQFQSMPEEMLSKLDGFLLNRFRSMAVV